MMGRRGPFLGRNIAVRRRGSLFLVVPAGSFVSTAAAEMLLGRRGAIMMITVSAMVRKMGRSVVLPVAKRLAGRD
jgi:hypothetical protein